jgi:hypothetical protein
MAFRMLAEAELQTIASEKKESILKGEFDASRKCSLNLNPDELWVILYLPIRRCAKKESGIRQPCTRGEKVVMVDAASTRD